MPTNEDFPGLTTAEKQQVPQALQEFSKWFIAAHNIRGSADPMYVCNATAFELSLGNGSGVFYSDTSTIINIRVCAGTADTYIMRAVQKLTAAYATCISATNGSKNDIKAHLVKMLVALSTKIPVCPVTEEDLITLNLTIQDDDGNTVDGATANLTLRRISVIVDLASQLILDKQSGKPLDAVLDRLEEELTEAGVI